MPVVAASQGLHDGDTVEVTSEVGKMQVEAASHEGHPPRLRLYDAGYGHLSMDLTTAYGLGACDSDLHVTYTDPISGGQALSQTFVTVKKIADAPAAKTPKPLYLGE